MAGYHKLTQRRLVGGSRNAICIQNWVGKAFNLLGIGVVDVLQCFLVGRLPSVGGCPVDTGNGFV